MSTKTFDTHLCEFVRHLDDEEIQWLLEAPTLVPELMGLTDHLPACAECGDRAGRILLGDSQSGTASANHPIHIDAKVVRSFPRNASGSNVSGISTLNSARANEVFSSLVQVVVGQRPVGWTPIGAAASHKTSKTSPRRWFTLMWKQGDDEWSMEGKGNEVELACASPTQPDFITWKNASTGQEDRVELRRSDDGRILVDIFPSKALMRAEAIRDTVDEAKRREMLPIVHIVGKAL